MSNNLIMGKTEWGLLFLLAIIWGGSYFFAKVALLEVTPINLVFMRVVLAAITLYLLIKFFNKKIPLSLTIWKSFFIMGLVNNIIPYALLFWAQTHINSSLAAIFNSTAPIFTIIIAHIFTRDERISKNKILGMIFGFLGVLILIGSDIKGSTSNWTITAMLACVVGAIFYSIASVYGRRFHQLNVEPLVVAFGQVTASSILLIPLIFTIGGSLNLTNLSINTIESILALAIISTALAYVLFFRILAKGGATNISLVALLIPISAIALGVIILGEKMQLSQIIGMLTIFTGLIVIDGRLWKYMNLRKNLVKSTNCSQ